jgi:GNAT superfamily N-acetyltransferase
MPDHALPIVRGYIPGIIADITHLHLDYYRTHWDIGLNFETTIAGDLVEFLRRYDDQQDAVWTVSHDEHVMGCIIINGSGAPDHEARLRYFIMGAALRGHGYGRRLMQIAIDFCDKKGYQRVYLKTLVGLDAAIHLYEVFGFTLYDEGWHDGRKELFFERTRQRS